MEHNEDFDEALEELWMRREGTMREEPSPRRSTAKWRP
jgi:hypothetical protein